MRLSKLSRYRVRLSYIDKALDITQVVYVKSFQPEYAVKHAREAFTEQFGVAPQNISVSEQ